MSNENQGGLQANPEYTINYLIDDNARLTKENAMLKAIIQEQNEKAQQQNEQQNEQVTE